MKLYPFMQMLKCTKYTGTHIYIYIYREVQLDDDNGSYIIDTNFATSKT